MAKNAKLPGWPDMLQPPFAGFAANGQDADAATAPAVAGMDFMKSLWGKLPSSVPGFVLPTLDIEELDKRIEDLRSVESWLTLNANMLKATIQGLEVQRNTLAALKALREKGDFLSAMTHPAAGAAPFQKAQEEAEPPDRSAFAGSTDNAKSKAAFADAFRQSFGSGAGNPNWPLPLEATDAARKENSDDAPPDTAPAQKVKKSARKKTHKGRAKAAPSRAAPASALVSSGAAQSANLWMNFLKDQFSQIATASLPAPAPAGRSAAASKVAKRPAAPRASTKRSVSGRAGVAPKAASKTAAKSVRKRPNPA